MMSRTTTASVAGRSSSMRRMRRRASATNAALRPFCRTNGCPTYLDVDADRGIATCPICGSTQRLH